MKFFEDIVGQQRKYGQVVCGDTYICDKTIERTVFILCDGIGSGAYANIAAISCASRLQELIASGVSLRAAAEMTAASMHKARQEDIPFSAFSAALFLNDGRFSVYTYESPDAICIMNGSAIVLKPTFYTFGYEVIGEATGVLDIGDSLVLSSDGVTQAGLGREHGLGIGSQGIVNFINRQLVDERTLRLLPDEALEMCASISGGRYEDDTTFAVVHCREASQITVLSGPPSQASKDGDYVADFMAAPGEKIICGSTTAEIVARELRREVTMLEGESSFGAPPEYSIQGIAITSEGSILLNQVYNILDEPAETFKDGVVERVCAKLVQADVAHFLVGNAVNSAHTALLFKQIGVQPRKKTIGLIGEKLKSMGKLVTAKYY